jgi:low temperature requirement protein LtrA
VVAAALGASEADFDLAAAVAAALGFLVVACLWWVYFDGHEAVTLKPTPAPLIYSYAHLPLLTALGAVGTGISLLIEGAGEDHLAAGAAALAGGCALYLRAALATHAMTAGTLWRTGVGLKVAAAAACVVLAFLGTLLPPVLTAALLLAVLLIVAGIQGTHVRGVLSAR